MEEDRNDLPKYETVRKSSISGRKARKAERLSAALSETANNHDASGQCVHTGRNKRIRTEGMDDDGTGMASVRESITVTLYAEAGICWREAYDEAVLNKTNL